jgi:hypothetical protein
MVWCNAKCNDAIPSTFIGLSKNVLYQKTTSGWLIKNGKSPKFWARRIKVGFRDNNLTLPKKRQVCKAKLMILSQSSEGKEIYHKGKF